MTGPTLSLLARWTSSVGDLLAFELFWSLAEVRQGV